MFRHRKRDFGLPSVVNELLRWLSALFKQAPAFVTAVELVGPEEGKPASASQAPPSVQAVLSKGVCEKGGSLSGARTPSRGEMLALGDSLLRNPEASLATAEHGAFGDCLFDSLRSMIET